MGVGPPPPPRFTFAPQIQEYARSGPPDEGFNRWKEGCWKHQRKDAIRPARQDAEPGFTSRKKGTRDDHGDFD
jgi:hypothetical protein